MGSFKHQECVKIVQCEVFEDNLVKGQKNSNCWDMAKNKKDFRFLYNICLDCIVYLFSQDDKVFSQIEIKQILTKRNISCYHG